MADRVEAEADRADRVEDEEDQAEADRAEVSAGGMDCYWSLTTSSHATRIFQQRRGPSFSLP